MSGSSKYFSKRAKVITGGTIIIAAILIYFITFYPWPAGSSSVSGTIGGVEKVKKYQKEQINAGDVSAKTGDIQQLLQNESIMTLINDPNFRTAVANEDFRTEFNRNPDFRNAIISASYRTTMSNRNWVEALRQEGFRNIVESGAFAKIISDGAMKLALRNDALRTSDYHTIVNRNEALRQLSNDAQFMTAMRDPSFRQLITSDGMRQLVDNRQFTEAFRSDAARTIFSDGAFLMALRQESFRNSVSSDGFLKAVSSDALSKYWDDAAFRTEVFRTDANRNIESNRNTDAQRNIESNRNIESHRTDSK